MSALVASSVDGWACGVVLLLVEACVSFGVEGADDENFCSVDKKLFVCRYILADIFDVT